MKNRLIALTLCLFISCLSTHTAAELLKPDSLISPEVAVEDIDKWLHFIESTHPDLAYTVKNPASFYHDVERLKSNLKKPIALRAYWLELMKFNSQFNDGHLSIMPDSLEDLVRQSIDEGDRVLPFQFKIKGDELIVLSNLNGKESKLKGYRVVSINSVPVAQIMPALLQLTHGDSATHRQAILSTRFSMYYWLLYGSAEKFVLDLKKDIFLANVSIDVSEQKSTDLLLPDHSFESNFAATILDDDAVLKIKSFRSYEENEKFTDFFDSFFTSIAEKNIRRLYIDIRGNGGGDDTWKKAIMPYIASKPWRSGSTYKVKILSGQGSDKHAVGDVVNGEVKDLEKVNSDLPNKFTGEVVILVDGFSYSSSILFINVVQDFCFGLVAGDAIGGKVGQTGGTQKLVLDNSGLKAISPRFILNRPNGGDGLDIVKIDLPINYDITESEELITQIRKVDLPKVCN
ncbi:S41 family peptidase [Rheinheimera sp. EpRS3]|uniref:S41 family peptidase n=1 Tax=Rheinheimera sp. EpRS3 TaxID=1712383 RepID=UPI0007484218|nr:S41 family peptidase [Rheinheimera sp. EpRS3]KUM53256.1 hypothetical protein AR688_04870 [Rheinheimera sp. EpRS3]